MPPAASATAESVSDDTGPLRAGPPKFVDRVLAEAVAVLERDRLEPLNDAAANARAQAVDGDFELRIVTRAAALPIASSLRSAMHHVQAALGWIVAVAMVAVIIAGA